MITNYFKTAWRNIRRNPAASLINLTGLALGMTVAMIIGLWIWNELSFNKNFNNYKNIAQVMITGTFSGEISTDPVCPVPLANKLQNDYKADFKRVALVTQKEPHTLNFEDKKLSPAGMFVRGDFSDIFSLQPEAGIVKTPVATTDVIISRSLAHSLFGNTDAIGRIVKMDNKDYFKITGVYKDFPKASDFYGIDYLASFNYYLLQNPGVDEGWNKCMFSIYVQLQNAVSVNQASAKISGLMKEHDVSDINPVVLLHPMSKWHLYETFKNGHNTGGRIQYVRMFGLIGIFVLLIACINFMNLSTARSETRAKEVGVLKAIGARRRQLIIRFIFESICFVTIAFAVSMLLTSISLNWFNRLITSDIKLPVTNIGFWIYCAAIVVFTGFIAGCYPAFYLSSFKPVKALKGSYKAGKNAALPRKILVVVQFCTSIFLIIATIIILQQLNHVRNRPLGYSKNGLINIPFNTADVQKHYSIIRDELLSSGAVKNSALSSSPVNKLMMSNGGYSWTGATAKDGAIFGTVTVNENFASTVDWRFKQGRNFSKEFLTDSTAVIINEAAAAYMGMQQAVGKELTFNNEKYNILGVIENTVMGSPFVATAPTAFFLKGLPMKNITIRLSPATSVTASLEKVKNIFQKYNPDAPFDYAFVDEQLARQFKTMETVSLLAGIFAGLAIFISCLGLYALALFVAEQRTKELGIRKVLGASVFGLWRLLSKEFIALVLIAFLIAVPAVYWSMSLWLDDYVYRITITWQVFAVAGVLIVFITLITISYQSIKAALANPVKSLRSE